MTEHLHGCAMDGACVSFHNRTEPTTPDEIRTVVTSYFQQHDEPITIQYVLFELLGFDPENYTVYHQLKNWKDEDARRAHDIVNRTLQDMMEEGTVWREKRSGRKNTWFWSKKAVASQKVSSTTIWNHNKKVFVKGLAEPISEEEALLLAANLIEAVLDNHSKSKIEVIM